MTKALLIKRILLGLVGFAVVTFLMMVVGLVKVGVFSGPMFYNDGKYHTVVEISTLCLVGYKFGTMDPNEDQGGWFRPICGGG